MNRLRNAVAGVGVFSADGRVSERVFVLVWLWRKVVMAETRKLAAILAADVVGYSRLAGADEDRTLARLRALRSDLIDPTIAVHNGRVVKRTGDGSSRRVPQRGRRRALRHRGAERHGRAQRRRSARAPHRVPRRHPSWRCGRGERRRPDGRRRQYRRAIGRDRRAGRICLSEDAYRQVKCAARSCRERSRSRPNSRTSPSRSGFTRWRSAPPRRNPRRKGSPLRWKRRRASRSPTSLRLPCWRSRT